jgi:hypothetical protein
MLDIDSEGATDSLSFRSVEGEAGLGGEFFDLVRDMILMVGVGGGI